jgi:hypothetical protein
VDGRYGVWSEPLLSSMKCGMIVAVLTSLYSN